jgi:hypothetical protein
MVKLEKKTGFVNLDKFIPIKILDERGILFYDTSSLKEPVKIFNLPAGQYNVISGRIGKLKEPVQYNLPSLPEKERRLKAPFDFTIFFDENPNKCTVNWLKKTIVFDTNLKTLSKPELFFMLYHEYGHALYHTEKYADLMAAKLMLIRGYNPSQIGNAPLTSLSHYQYLRKKHIIDKISNL